MTLASPPNMALPFSREQFIELFGQYNLAVWPTQLLLLGLAIVGVLSVTLRPPRERAIGWVLALLWTWMAVGYHFVFFTTLNPAAWLFGAAFLAAAFSFARHAARGTLRFDLPNGTEGIVAVVMLVYAFIGYPVIGALAGDIYPWSPTFGLPCPTTIFTLGMLLLARRPVPKGVWVVPLAWSAIGSSAAAQLGIAQDFGLVVAGLVVGTLLLRRWLVAPRPIHA
jgi:hypothetical protein